jgi:hypothetical protein
MYYFVFGVISWSIHSIRSLNLSYRKKLKRKNLSLTPFSLAAACFPPSSLPPARPTPSWAGWRVAHLARPPPRASPSFGTTGWRARPSSRGSVARLGAAQLGGPAAPCAPQRPRSLRARARWAVAQPPPPLVGPTSQPHHHAPVHLLSPTHIFSPSPHAARPSPPPHPRRSEPPPSTPSARPSSHGEPRLPLFFLAPPLLPHPGPCLPRPLAQHGHGACAPPPRVLPLVPCLRRPGSARRFRLAPSLAASACSWRGPGVPARRGHGAPAWSGLAQSGPCPAQRGLLPRSAHSAWSQRARRGPGALSSAPARPWRGGAARPLPLPGMAPSQCGPDPARLRLSRSRCPCVARRVRSSAPACARHVSAALRARARVVRAVLWRDSPYPRRTRLPP